MGRGVGCAHYLIQAWKELKGSFQLDVCGYVGLPTVSLKGLPDSISFHAAVSKARLFEYYLGSDVLVFPTLSDGFGMVVTEALAHGLPVITTERAGAADLVTHGENGFIIPPGDSDALAFAMQWCVEHRTEVRQMRKAAVRVAAGWQWKDFRQAHGDLIGGYLGGRENKEVLIGGERRPVL